MENPIINFDDFELPFTSISSELVDNEELEDYEVKENMQDCIPENAILLGVNQYEIDNWTCWSTQDEYYIIPLSGETYNWALFRISWDDNWETWNWCFDARLLGFQDNYKEAAKFMLTRLWERWQLDLDDPDYESYVNFLNDL